MDDEQLIALYLNRDEGAIAETQEAFGTKLRQLAFRLLGNSEDVEECLNDTYFKVWNAIPPHRPNSLYAFCVTICRRTAMDMLDNILFLCSVHCLKNIVSFHKCTPFPLRYF